MPWTKINYPDSMKKLPVVVRNKAIQIANAILKENKKMNERILIATSIKQAKDILLKSEKKSKSADKKKTKSVRAKKIKSTAKNKVKIVSEKKIKNPAKNKAKIVAKKNIKSVAKTKTKSVVEKKVKKPSKIKANIVVREETKKSIKEKAKSPVIEPSIPVIITHGEDLHFIPEQGEIHPITTLEAHQVENIFHHREEVALHQENQKVKEAMATRKNSKKFYRITGRR